jgi:hypothetical protein
MISLLVKRRNNGGVLFFNGNTNKDKKFNTEPIYSTCFNSVDAIVTER